MAAESRVFLSAVTSEFGSARRELRKDFGTRRMDVATQEELSHLTGAGTLLALLDVHIRDCKAVVCVIGRRSGGSFPTVSEAAAYAGLLPPEMPRASYTQWEFLLARRHGRPMIVLCPAPDCVQPPDVADADLAAPDDTALQAAFFRYIEALGVPRIPFSDTNGLCRAVMRQPWVAAAPVAAAEMPVVLPYPSIGSLFKGRDSFLDRLHASLHKGGTAAIAGKAVHGMGGVGKTRAAVEYAWRYRNDYTALFLLSAETPDKLRSAVAALAVPLHLAAAALPEEEARLEAVLAWLNANPGWLLILDNIDTAPALQAAHALLGRLRGGGHVLMTSRLTRFPRDIERLDLDVLEPDAAGAFLLEATPGRRRAPDDARPGARPGRGAGGLGAGAGNGCGDH
jgi:hypothetical protein